MNVLNRLLVLGGLLVMMAGAALILIITAGVWPADHLVPSPWAPLLTPWSRLGGAPWWSVVTICLGLLGVGLLLMMIELLTWRRRQPSAVTIKKDHLGTITVSHISIQDLVNREAEAIDGVRESATAVREKGDGVTLHCRLSVTSNNTVSVLAAHVQDTVKSAVERYLGKPVTGLHIQTQLAPLEKHSAPYRVR